MQVLYVLMQATEPETLPEEVLVTQVVFAMAEVEEEMAVGRA
jgi:hypothetical protein